MLKITWSNFIWVIVFKTRNMKKNLLSVIAYMIVITGFAQTNDSIPNPEFTNEVYYYDKTNTKLIPLEKTNAEYKARMKIIGGGSAAYAIGGERSATRLQQSEHSFVITIPGGSMMDPAMMITLYRFEPRKGQREATMSQYASNGKRSGGSAVEIKFKRIKEGTYEIILTSELAKGEYGFINAHSMNHSGGMTTYAFGID
jgi:hypothetical protein